MNDDLFCSVHVESALPRNATASLVAELTGGMVSRGGVDLPWGRIAVGDDYGTVEVREADRRASSGVSDACADRPRDARAGTV